MMTVFVTLFSSLKNSSQSSLPPFCSPPTRTLLAETLILFNVAAARRFTRVKEQEPTGDMVRIPPHVQCIMGTWSFLLLICRSWHRSDQRHRSAQICRISQRDGWETFQAGPRNEALVTWSTTGNEMLWNVGVKLLSVRTGKQLEVTVTH